MKRIEAEPRPYPTDKNGLAIPVKELGLFDFTTGEHRNTHHYNFYRRQFGQLAISQTFRDLDAQQVSMPVSEHEKLHRLFTGIALPSLDVMLTEIERSRSEDRRLRVYIPEQGYTFEPITAVLFNSLLKEYNEVGHGQR